MARRPPGVIFFASAARAFDRSCADYRRSMPFELSHKPPANSLTRDEHELIPRAPCLSATAPFLAARARTEYAQGKLGLRASVRMNSPGETMRGVGAELALNPDVCVWDTRSYSPRMAFSMFREFDGDVPAALLAGVHERGLLSGTHGSGAGQGRTGRAEFAARRTSRCAGPSIAATRTSTATTSPIGWRADARSRRASAHSRLPPATSSSATAASPAR